MTSSTRNTILITGASGGMGRNLARHLGSTSNLILNDVSQEVLDTFSGNLTDEGYTVLGSVAGDLTDLAVIARLSALAAEHGGIDSLIHTAGLSPTQASWKKILYVNIMATQLLLDATLPLMKSGGTAVMIASMAGYVDPALPEADDLLDQPLTNESLDELKPFLFPQGEVGETNQKIASQLAYVLSKRAVIRLVEKSALKWGTKQARIVSISPGLMYTPMGIKEAENDTRTLSTINSQPVSRWGTASDITSATAYLISPAASFITGCDLRVDGGASLLSKWA